VPYFRVLLLAVYCLAMLCTREEQTLGLGQTRFFTVIQTIRGAQLGFGQSRHAIEGHKRASSRGRLLLTRFFRPEEF
jgi:hypothetical protein